MDYIEIFVIIVKQMNYKYVFVIKVKYDYPIYYMNIVMAFLYSFFNKIIDVEQPYFFVIKPDIVCKLIKIL